MTQLPRTVVGWEGRGGRGGLVIYSNVSLCSVLVLPPPPSERPPHQRLGVLRKKEKKGKKGEARRRWEEEKTVFAGHGSGGVKKKGRKTQLPHLNAPQGGVRRAGVGEEGCEPTMLQIYSGRAVRAPSCSFLQPVKTNCRSVSIISLLCHGPEVCSFFLFGPANHFFPLFPNRGRKVPAMSHIYPPEPRRRPLCLNCRCQNLAGRQRVLINCQHFWFRCHRGEIFFFFTLPLSLPGS